MSRAIFEKNERFLIYDIFVLLFEKSHVGRPVPLKINLVPSQSVKINFLCQQTFPRFERRITIINCRDCVKLEEYVFNDSNEMIQINNKNSGLMIETCSS